MVHVRSGRVLGVLHGALLTIRFIASACVLLVGFGWLGPWTGLPVLAWVFVAPLLQTRVGERTYMRVGGGTRQPSVVEETLLESVLAAALSRCGLDGDRVDHYVRHRDASVNAYAAGRRSIAVSAGFLSAVASGAVPHDQAQAVLLHEIGHLEDPSARRRLTIAWLTGPWRMVQVLLTRMIRVVARRAPVGKGGLLLLPVAASVAVVQLAHERAWLPLALVVGLWIVVVVNPLVTAAVSRRAELAADDYVARAGSAEQLAALLRQRPHESRGCLAGLYAAHPVISRRVERLAAAQC